MGEAEPGLAEDGEGRDIVEMMLVVAPPQHSTGTPRRSPAGRKRRSDAGRSVKGLGEIASIAKLRNMFMGNVTAMQSYGSMMNYDKDGEHIKLTPQQIKKVRAAFDLYDEDKSGAISADEMAKARAASRDARDAPEPRFLAGPRAHGPQAHGRRDRGPLQAHRQRRQWRDRVRRVRADHERAGPRLFARSRGARHTPPPQAGECRRTSGSSPCARR